MYYSARASWPAFFTTLEFTTHCFADKNEGCKSVEECFATQAYAVPEGSCETKCLPENVSLVCGGLQLRTECDRLGMECTSSGCSPYPASEPCNPETIDLCQDGIPRHCPAGATEGWRGVPCGDYGLVCSVIQVGDAPWSVCQGTGPACDSASLVLDDQVKLIRAELGCAGTDAKTCINKAEHVYDCASLGHDFSCQGAGTQAFCGLAAECEVGATFATTCEGDSVVVCNGGRADRIDCKALGFEGCDPDVGLCYPSPASTR
jgi:hypothetical protein